MSRSAPDGDAVFDETGEPRYQCDGLNRRISESVGGGATAGRRFALQDENFNVTATVTLDDHDFPIRPIRTTPGRLKREIVSGSSRDVV